MKSILKTVVFTSLVIILSGCASKITPLQVKAENNSSVGVFNVPALSDLNNNRRSDLYLREVTPAHAGTGMGLAVLGVVLTGSINTSDFDKENYTGNTLKNIPNPTNAYFSPKAQERIKQWLEKNGNGYIYQQPLTLGYATWALIYKNLSATDSIYELKYKIIFYKRPEKGNIFSSYITADCSPVPAEADLADWRKDSYKKVADETEKYMDVCLSELESQLPRLLKQ